MRRPEPSPVLPVPERKLPKPSLTRNLPGLTVVAFGLAMASVAVTYPLGSLLRPGPGFFPLVIALILAALGVGVMVEARAALPPEEREPFAWRAVLCTSAGILLFAFLVERIGYVPASLLLIGTAALGERDNDWIMMAVVAAFMAFFGTAVFIWGLGLPIRAFGAS